MLLSDNLAALAPLLSVADAPRFLRSALRASVEMTKRGMLEMAKGGMLEMTKG